jgi:hypothetical protein
LPLRGGEEEESVREGTRCAPDASVRRYDLVAINIEITLNRFLDYDPEGRMYALEEELAWARLEEAQNKAARAGMSGHPPYPLGFRETRFKPSRSGPTRASASASP